MEKAPSLESDICTIRLLADALGLDYNYLLTLNETIDDDPDMRIIARAKGNMSPEQQQEMMTISHLLVYANGGSVHLNPPGSRYCITCGAPNVFGKESAVKRLILYDYLLKRGKPIITDNEGGLPPVKCGPNIPVTTHNGQYKITKCPKWLNEDIDLDTDFCIMCGTSLTNICDGEPDYDGDLIQHSTPANARFCHVCGRPTAYSRLAILPRYQDALRKIAETEQISRELAETDIDESLFWKMQGEEAPERKETTTTENDSLEDNDDGELPF